jgi:hypothetical protein
MMTTPAEFKAAFAGQNNSSIKVTARSGKEYWLHADQLPCIEDGGLAYGVPISRHPRDKRHTRWLQPENVSIIKLEG